MKVLLDEMLPAGVAAILPGHDVTTVKSAGSRAAPDPRRQVPSGSGQLGNRRERPAKGLFRLAGERRLDDVPFELP